MHHLLILIKSVNQGHQLWPFKTPDSIKISTTYKVIIEKIAKNISKLSLLKFPEISEIIDKINEKYTV